jgi:hypothetical protein
MAGRCGEGSMSDGAQDMVTVGSQWGGRGVHYEGGQGTQDGHRTKV